MRYHGNLEPLGLATIAIARQARTPAAVHLDHATNLSLVSEALELGFTSVMFDASQLPYEDNPRLSGDAKLVDPRRYVAPGRDALVAEAEYLLRLIAGGPFQRGSAGGD